jgi:hypothetical protein
MLQMVAPRLKEEFDAPTTTTDFGLKNFSINDSP